MLRGSKPRERLRNRPVPQQGPPEMQETPLTHSLPENIQAARSAMGVSDDLVEREFRLGPRGTVSAAALCVGGLVEPAAVDDFILRSLTSSGTATDQSAGDNGTATDQSAGDARSAFLHIKESALAIADISEASTLEQVLTGLLNGSTAILIDGHAAAILAGTAGWKMRQVAESAVEATVRGSREAFIEDLATSIAAVRRRIRHPRLQVQKLKLGDLTQTGIAILYVEGVAKPEIVREVQTRLSRIRIDGILESGYIEELIEDNYWSPFPQIEHTERPDKVAGALLEGRVAILTDGTPMALLAPAGLVQFLQATEDYYERYPVAMFVRALRFTALFIALYGPAFYVSAITYHQEMIPLILALNVAGALEGVPFPAFVEALIMELAFELLREAGIRLPRPVGTAVSIVGGLVIGDAAVRAGVVSPGMVIVVASTGIASFAIPAFNMAITLRLLRFALLGIGAFSGLPGLTLSGVALLFHLASLRSFGVPYLAPLAPGDVSAWKDTLIRVPWWAMDKRPRQTAADLPRLQQRRLTRHRPGNR